MDKSSNSKKLILKLSQLDKAILSFEKLMDLDLNQFDNEIVLDGIKNGQLQKFEYTLELLWKNLKSYLEIEKGQNEIYPKEVFRAIFPMTKLTENEKESCLMMIDDRNKIAHEYKEYIMENVYPKLKIYLKFIQIIRSAIKTQKMDA